MLLHVHHIDYRVKSRAEMIAFMEKAFGMKPERLSEREGASKIAHYRVGQVLVRFAEPWPGSKDDIELQKNGPGLSHVAWDVGDLHKTEKILQDNGVLGKDDEGAHRTAAGYEIINIDLAKAHGIKFQLAQRPPSTGSH